MPGSNWGERTSAVDRWAIGIFAFLMMAITIVGLSPDWAQSDGPESSKSHYYQSQCEEAKARNWTQLGNVNEAKAHKKNCANQCEEPPLTVPPDFCDMAAQYRSAEASELSSRAAQASYNWTVLGVVAILFTLGCTVWAVWETRRVTIVTRDHSTKELRAYLTVGMQSVNFQVSDKGSYVFTPGIKNVGATPAKEVTVSLVIHGRKAVNMGIPTQLFFKIVGGGPKPIGTIFPNDEIALNSALASGEHPKIAMLDFSAINETDHIGIVVKISYRDIHGELRTTKVDLFASDSSAIKRETPDGASWYLLGLSPSETGNDYT